MPFTISRPLIVKVRNKSQMQRSFVSHSPFRLGLGVIVFVIATAGPGLGTVDRGPGRLPCPRQRATRRAAARFDAGRCQPSGVVNVAGET